MSMESEYRIAVIDGFQALQDELHRLREAMCQIDADLPGWFDELPTGLPRYSNQTDRQNAFTLIQQLEYVDHQKPKEILIGAGIFAASQTTLERIEALNHCKDRFKNAMLTLKSAKILITDPFLNEQFDTLLNKRPDVFSNTLKKVGLARLHLKQCYRRIPYFHKRPEQVAWTWANTKAITRISVEDALALLSKQSHNPAIDIQINRLKSLHVQEPLARVQELAPHLRVNVVLEIIDNKQKRIMVKGPIPLFYLAEEGRGLPKIRPPGIKKGRNQERPVRKDVKLESEPFLPAIRVHRYIAGTV